MTMLPKLPNENEEKTLFNDLNNAYKRILKHEVAVDFAFLANPEISNEIKNAGGLKQFKEQQDSVLETLRKNPELLEVAKFFIEASQDGVVSSEEEKLINLCAKEKNLNVGVIRNGNDAKLVLNGKDVILDNDVASYLVKCSCPNSDANNNSNLPNNKPANNTGKKL
jgi:hypothetical protein